MISEIGRLGEQQEALKQALSERNITEIYNGLGDSDKLENLIGLLESKIRTSKEGMVNLLEKDEKGNKALLLIGFAKGRKRIVGIATDFDIKDSSIKVFYKDNYQGSGELVLKRGGSLKNVKWGVLTLRSKASST